MSSSWRDHLVALGALRRRVAVQSSVDAGQGVKARRVLFSPGKPIGDMLAALGALDHFERAIVECAGRQDIEARRLKCLAILDRLIANTR
ncbi:hypothetical protein FJ987_05550 [Mesorhizobium sp. CU2]|uniref:hypothetical protein n=1 Tax=unclassified Mesorhizobium TaxID=325217 RepID=UPI00112B097D|nr:MULTISPECIES: hypothetical protein [unclassified Mesorhizobium]TPN79534.1 hypothetical protein FJ988_22725 [Mesorhizobium sp. CU3]TPO20007.1 hypothetical protein FJ987_05550 [Mesorhizobium sp. CU2]